MPGGDQTLDLLPSAGLVTSSEDYYPTVAINALMRVLREPTMASLHGKAVQALFEIIKAMGLSFVPYLPKARAQGGSGAWLLRQCCLLAASQVKARLGHAIMHGWNPSVHA